MVNLAHDSLWGEVEVDETWVEGTQADLRDSRELKGRVLISEGFDLRRFRPEAASRSSHGPQRSSLTSGQLVQHLTKVASDRRGDLESARFLNEPASDQQPRQGHQFFLNALLKTAQQIAGPQDSLFFLLKAPALLKRRLLPVVLQRELLIALFPVYDVNARDLAREILPLPPDGFGDRGLPPANSGNRLFHSDTPSR